MFTQIGKQEMFQRSFHLITLMRRDVGLIKLINPASPNYTLLALLGKDECLLIAQYLVTNK